MGIKPLAKVGHFVFTVYFPPSLSRIELPPSVTALLQWDNSLARCCDLGFRTNRVVACLVTQPSTTMLVRSGLTPEEGDLVAGWNGVHPFSLGSSR